MSLPVGVAANARSPDPGTEAPILVVDDEPKTLQLVRADLERDFGAAAAELARLAAVRTE